MAVARIFRTPRRAAAVSHPRCTLPGAENGHRPAGTESRTGRGRRGLRQWDRSAAATTANSPSSPRAPRRDRPEGRRRLAPRRRCVDIVRKASRLRDHPLSGWRFTATIDATKTTGRTVSAVATPRSMRGLWPAGSESDTRRRPIQSPNRTASSASDASATPPRTWSPVNGLGSKPAMATTRASEASATPTRGAGPARHIANAVTNVAIPASAT